MKKYGPSLPPRLAKKRKAEKKTEMKRMLPGPYGEAKYVDLAHATYNFDTTGNIVHCSIIPQGSTVGQREGRTCLVTAAHIRGQAYTNTTTLVAGGAMLLVWDNQPNKALAAIDDILDSKSSNSQNKRENVNRFKILRRWNFAFTGNSNTAGQQTATSFQVVDYYVKLPKGCISVYTTADTTGVIANCIQGALLLVTIGQSGAGAIAPMVACNVRTSFKDI